jgi:hypothetical protein
MYMNLNEFLLLFFAIVRNDVVFGHGMMPAGNVI